MIFGNSYTIDMIYNEIDDMIQCRESDDCLFHFTRRYESLISIMTEKFKPFFCIEDVSQLYGNQLNLTMAYPMTCFCDIPIERHANHKKVYGNYGIAMTKEWGIDNHLSPVNYIHPDCTISSALKVMNGHVKYLPVNDITQVFKNCLNILLMTSKPYEGKVFDKDKRLWSSEVHRFYDEKEWRHLPLVDKSNWHVSLEDLDGDWNLFYQEIEKEQTKIQQIEYYKLKFTIKDIKHIFLEQEEDKIRFINDLSSSYSPVELEQIEDLIYPS